MNGQKKRIAFVLPTLLPGGAERVLITLMNGLDRYRFDPHFIVVNPKGTLRPLIDSSIPFHSLGGVKMRFALPGLISRLNALEPDIIVSTMAAMNFTVLLARPFLKKKSRVIVREAVIPSSIIKSQPLPGIVSAAYKNLYPRADLVLAPAQCILDDFATGLKMDTSHYRVLHNPVDTARLTHEWGIDVDIPESRRKTVHFVASGRLHRQKGFDRLIEALPLLNHSGDWRLQILGDGKEKENLQSLIAKNNLESRVELMGLLENPWPHYAAADVFLLPSRWEGLPNVVLESLALGTPAIAMKEAGGIDEIAKAAPEGSVKIAGSMDEFLSMMRDVKPNPAASARPSLLPESFQIANVLKKFSGFLEGGGS